MYMFHTKRTAACIIYAWESIKAGLQAYSNRSLAPLILL